MAHFYNEDGALIDRILSKKGTPKKVNIVDARKMQLYPSVTELLKLFSKPALTKWMITNAITKALENPKHDRESTEEYINRITNLSKETGQTAANFGVLMHGAIEDYLSGNNIIIDDTIKDYWPHVEKFLKEHVGVGQSESVIVNTDIGFAGTCDYDGEAFNVKRIVIDFKTQGTKKTGRVNYYNEWRYQLGGYTINSDIPCASVVISSDEPGRIEYKIYDKEDMVKARLIFKKLCEIFSLSKDLPMGWWADDIKELEEQINANMQKDDMRSLPVQKTLGL